MDPPSGNFKAGTILLLVGAILHLVVSLLLLGCGAFFLVIQDRLSSSSSAPFPGLLFASIYLVLGVLAALGKVFGFLAHSKAQQGDAHGAWVMGLVSSLLPPVQVVTLIGAILCLTSPEGEASKRA